MRVLASMPTTGARRNLQRLFDKFQDDGPNSFTNVGLLGQNLMDPAFLLIAKKAYHDRDAQRTARPRTAGRTDDGYGGGYGAAGGVAGMDPWEQEVESYVRFLSETLAAGDSPWQPAESPADAAAGSGEGNGDAGPLGSMPVRLHRGAEVVEEYHARWPVHAANKLPGANVAPLEIHYVRVEGEERPATLANFYKRQAGRRPIERVSDGGGWIDGLVDGDAEGDRHSFDIRIYNDPATSGVNAQLRPNDERPVVVEILTVTIPASVPKGDTLVGPTADAGQTSATDDAAEADEELPF
jgi:hypothetical protein